MKSRLRSALDFGLCFAILFGSISVFAPKIKHYTCFDQGEKGTKSIAVYDMTLSGKYSCDAHYEYTHTTGFPFASTVKYNNTSSYEQDNGPDRQDFSSTWKFKPRAIAANFFVYWVVAFAFFFVFSRSRKKPKAKKSKDVEQ